MLLFFDAHENLFNFMSKEPWERSDQEARAFGSSDDRLEICSLPGRFCSSKIECQTRRLKPLEPKTRSQKGPAKPQPRTTNSPTYGRPKSNTTRQLAPPPKQLDLESNFGCPSLAHSPPARRGVGGLSDYYC